MYSARCVISVRTSAPASALIRAISSASIGRSMLHTAFGSHPDCSTATACSSTKIGRNDIMSVVAMPKRLRTRGRTSVPLARNRRSSSTDWRNRSVAALRSSTAVDICKQSIASNPLATLLVLYRVSHPRVNEAPRSEAVEESSGLHALTSGPLPVPLERQDRLPDCISR